MDLCQRMAHYSIRNPASIPKHLDSSNSDCLDFCIGQHSIAFNVKVRLVTHVVGYPIDFHGKSRLGAIEIKHEPANRVLPAEAQPLRITAQVALQHYLGL